MAVHLKIYASYLWELCTASVLPFEFVSVAEQFIERLDQFAAAEALDLAGAAARARAFGASARKLDDCAQAWRGRYDKGEKDEAAAAVDRKGVGEGKGGSSRG